MLRFSFLFFLLTVQLWALAQASDFISVRRKNGRVLKTFIAGTPIAFETRSGSYVQGPISAIRNDSLFVTQYGTARYPSRLGTVITDTVWRRVAGYHYRDIVRVTLTRRHRFVRERVDKMLMLGGGGYFVVNLVNAPYVNESVTNGENLKRLGIAAGVAGLGFALNKVFKAERESLKNQKIVYVRVR